MNKEQQDKDFVQVTLKHPILSTYLWSKIEVSNDTTPQEIVDELNLVLKRYAIKIEFNEEKLHEMEALKAILKGQGLYVSKTNMSIASDSRYYFVGTVRCASE